MSAPDASDLEQAITRLGTAENAAILKTFFKTGPGEYGEGDLFLGVKNPQTRSVAKQFKKFPLDRLAITIQSPYHEIRLCTLLILVEQFAKADNDMQEKILDFYLSASQRQVNNWDLVDLSAPGILGYYLLNHEEKEEKLLNYLSQSEIMWQNRIAIVSTLTLIRHGKFSRTIELAQKFLTHPHPLMHKACGWMLREIGKRNREILTCFLRTHLPAMPRTMLRYAIEHYPEPERKAFLKRNTSNINLKGILASVFLFFLACCPLLGCCPTSNTNTVHVLVDETGLIVEYYYYDAFGNLKMRDEDYNWISESNYGNRFLFQGKEYDYATALYYFRSRWYEPETGRWLSPDPIGISGGLNLYAFCNNDPVNFVDPMGEDFWITKHPLYFWEGGLRAPVDHWSINVGNPNGEYSRYGLYPGGIFVLATSGIVVKEEGCCSDDKQTKGTEHWLYPIIRTNQEEDKIMMAYMDCFVTSPDKPGYFPPYLIFGSNCQDFALCSYECLLGLVGYNRLKKLFH